ncbi:tyrosine-protein phosphatase non-receptor type 12 isoform X2 [Clupea harengus]|uniref:protein-tyrosine-phosphatase n=1 Tax=Clupea harengus TaxID=7950 RepID=A0A6P8GTW0_CLUHA|nr:tyrosine-protein phosphatase non-receptor type 12 isoform X2 [Clupea harengus]
MDQASILRKFIQGVETMRTGERLGEDNFGTDFMRLRRLSTKYRTEKIYPTNVGEREENVKKNRYKDILPFDHSRVQVSLKSSNQDSDYINANFIKGMEGPETYIATQGPLPNTIIDFWRMNWEYNIAVIIMACREFEMGRKKCEKYFPMFGDEPMTFGPFKISCESEQGRTDYFIRLLVVEFENETRRLTQFHYINWPDHDVPSSFDSILDMISLMREHQQHDHTPICVHCSAGCGRTGAICAIDYTWNLLKAGKIPEDFNVFRLIQEMRTQRHSAVQTKEQYELVHRAISQLFEKQLQVLESPGADITDGMDEVSPEKPAQNSDEERWDTPPPKPPRIRSQVEGDVREEILQPPEPRPVPPILTPSPPSAFPTVTNVSVANDRYHPKPVLHVLAAAAAAAAAAAHGSAPPARSPEEDDAPQATSPAPGSSPECRVERKLSIEIKKVPLQEGPISFQSGAAGAGGGGMLQRSHAFKSRGSAPANGSSAPSNSSSLSEDSGVETGGEGAAPPRPNHLPLTEERQGPAPWAPSSPTPEHTPSPAPPAQATPTRTALCFTNPLHSDLEADAPSPPHSTVSMATGSVSAPPGDVAAPTRRVSSLSIAGQSASTQPNRDVSEESPPPLPERTPESFLLPSDLSEPLGSAGSALWCSSPTDQHTRHSPEGMRRTQARPVTDEKASATEAAEVEGPGSESSPVIGFGSRGTQPKGPRDPPSTWT